LKQVRKKKKIIDELSSVAEMLVKVSDCNVKLGEGEREESLQLLSKPSSISN
jgi:hypothetical protein